MPPKTDLLDPEELMRRKFRAKCLFRALGRLVMENRYWLIEGVDDYQGDDVKRRVEQAVRLKYKKQLLNIKDKALLNKYAPERTVQEQRYLYRILGDLKCFKRYPNHVKKKLAALTYFKYYGPNRVIVRQHQEGHALYCIVTGTVTVSQMVYDELLQQHISVDIGTLTTHDMFGEVSLLHDIPRSATVTTNGHCEFLTLMKEDFKKVLQVSVQKQWDEVRRAMSMFTYFDGLDEVSKREGCIVAKMKSYAPNDTLLGDGVGVQNFVYFTLSGRCQMIESLKIIVTERLGRKYFSLHDPYIPKVESEQDFDKKWFDAYKDRLSCYINENKSDADVDIVDISQPGIIKRHGGLKYNRSQKSVTGIKEGQSITLLKKPRESEQQSTSHVLLPTCSDAITRNSGRLSLVPTSGLTEMRTVLKPTSTMLPPNIRTFFMQVVIFNPGSSFGFGENMHDRRIVALTPVSCMLLPKVWLLQRNTANIWTRIQHYLEKKIPTKKQLFKEFVSSQKWKEYRDQLVSDVLARSNTVNSNSVHNVPYSIRMEEMFDI